MTIKSYKVVGGIMQVSVDTANQTPLMVVPGGEGNLGAVLSYLRLNTSIGVGQAVGVEVDSDGNGVADSLYVYEKSGSPLPNEDDVLIGLKGVVGVTLGNAVGANVVQIGDSGGPAVVNATLASLTTGTGTKLTLQFNEGVVSADLSGVTIRQFSSSGQEKTWTAAGTPTVSGSTVTVTSSTVFAAGDYVVITPTDRTHQSVTDATGQTGLLFDASAAGVVIGSTAAGGNGTIDISAVTGSGVSTTSNLMVQSWSGNNTIVGNAGNNQIVTGSGSDVITAGAGDDMIYAGTGSDAIDAGTGADKLVFFQGDSGTGVVNVAAGGVSTVLDTGDTITFGGKTDVITGGFGQVGRHGDRVELINHSVVTQQLSQITSTNGLVGDQQFALVQGNYNVDTGVFTVNTSTGADTVVIYDGVSRSLGQTGSSSAVLSLSLIHI